MPPPTTDSGAPFTRPHPRFIGGLIGVAAVVLGIGAALRPPAKAATTAVPTNELATLPERSQRRTLRDMAEYVRERAETFSLSVAYLPEYHTSALALAPDSLLTVIPNSSGSVRATSPAVRILLIRPLPIDSGLRAAPRLEADTLPPRWGLAVARTKSGQTLSLAGLTGGVIETFCGDLGFRELLFDAPLPLAMSGGGLFDLDGNLIAQAVPCGGRIALVPLPDLLWALKLQPTSGSE